MFKSNKLIIFLISLPFQCFRQSQSNFWWCWCWCGLVV